MIKNKGIAMDYTDEQKLLIQKVLNVQITPLKIDCDNNVNSENKTTSQETEKVWLKSLIKQLHKALW